MTRNQISGAVGLILGLGICVVMYFVSPPGEFSIGLIPLVLIALGIYYLFFAKQPVEEKPDVDPADRVRTSKPD